MCVCWVTQSKIRHFTNLPWLLFSAGLYHVSSAPVLGTILSHGRWIENSALSLIFLQPGHRILSTCTVFQTIRSMYDFIKTHCVFILWISLLNFWLVCCLSQLVLQPQTSCRSCLPWFFSPLRLLLFFLKPLDMCSTPNQSRAASFHSLPCPDGTGRVMEVPG